MGVAPRSARHDEHRPSRPPISHASLQIGTLFVVEVLLLWVLGLAVVGSTDTGLIAPLDERVADAVGLAATGAARTAAAAFTSLGSAVVLIPLVALIAVVARRRHSWTPVVTATVAIGGAEAVSQVVKRLIERPRPAGASALGFAFPSGHATFAAATFLTLALLVKARRRRHLAVASAVACTAAVAWSRLALGQHWLSDVTVGALVGWSWAVAATVVVSAPASAARVRRREARPGAPRSPQRETTAGR